MPEQPNELTTVIAKKEIIMTEEKSQLTNSVRQVLMNELGLTRESIRQEVRDIVAETVQKFMHVEGGQFWPFLADQISKALRTYCGGSDELKKLIAATVASQVEVLVREEVKRMLQHIEIISCSGSPDRARRIRS